MHGYKRRAASSTMLVGLGLVALVGSAGSLHAQQAYDGFDYSWPGSFGGQVGGTGWAPGSTWQVSTMFVAQTGLSALGDSGSGRAVFFDTQSTGSDARRDLPIPLNGTYGRDNTDMWISFLVRMNNANGCGRHAGVMFGQNPNVTYWFGISNFPVAGCNNSVSRAAVSPSFLSVPAGWAPTTGGPDILVNQVYRITAHVQFVAGPDTITVYAQPGTAGGIGPMVAQRNDIDVQTFRTIRILGGGGTSTWTSLDELRVGGTLAQALPPPPPPPPPTCDGLDFNGDGDFPTPLDLEDFIAANAGNPCATCSTDLDFNNDGDFPTPLDIEAFISVNAGGPCL